MRDWDMRTKRDGELLAKLLNIPEPLLAAHTLREIVTAPQAIRGIGEKRREKIEVFTELARRWFTTQYQLEEIHGPQDVAYYLMPRFKAENREQFVLMALNVQNGIIATRIIAVGSLTAAVVHPREVFREAILYSASAIVVAHNHPSGVPEPSREDKLVTRQLKKCGEIMDIPVLDHVILGENSFYSFKEKRTRTLEFFL